MGSECVQSSTNYADQYIRSYSGHVGPVYRVAWSPFCSSCFLSASADWTLKLWVDKQVCSPGSLDVQRCAHACQFEVTDMLVCQ